MSTTPITRRAALSGVAAAAMLALAACSSGNPLSQSSSSSGSGSGSAIVIGSQAYYSNEIIAEIYAQGLEKQGLKVERRFNIGQRDAYMPDVESGAISLFPEYTGNLLEFLQSSATSTSPDAVYADLKKALPKNLVALDYAKAADQDTYTVTKAFADKYGLKTIADLAKVPTKVTIGGAPEFQKRPYGPDAAKKDYGVDLAFSATGPTTLEALRAGTVQVADIYSADPAFEQGDLVTLEDPKNMILSSNVVPIVSSGVADKVSATINAISAKLSTQELVKLNVQSTVDKKQPADIAKAWLSANGLA
ncbi:MULTISPECIES: ABC transporter substrate-binding protein [Arthrobacter]|uniref:ABC transporter substrate-binding protein n=2 Tax=Arthrobacter TaxID=1663 RepID=A0ABU9KRJ9_9MICC|nr:ABC transporter substrate-binding protein [Arthrobacter sp. YJM1]MDP5228704.1 ABC transporter substrate-binding protein [Arthrobacter sp. YJM1]